MADEDEPEFSAFSALVFADLQYGKFDTDDDGYLNHDEFKAFWEMSLQHTACDCVFSRPVFENVWHELSALSWVSNHIDLPIFEAWIVSGSCDF